MIAVIIMGAYRSWTVMEFEIQIFKAWKVMELGLGPGKLWKVMENKPNGCRISDLCTFCEILDSAFFNSGLKTFPFQQGQGHVTPKFWGIKC